MTVNELIEHLSKFDPNATVTTYDSYAQEDDDLFEDCLSYDAASNTVRIL